MKKIKDYLKSVTTIEQRKAIRNFFKTPVVLRHRYLLAEKTRMKKAIDTINQKKLGVLIIRNKLGNTIGIITDGDLKRMAQKYQKLQNLELTKVMKKKPLSIEKDKLAAHALSIMNSNKITSLCVHNKQKLKKTIGIIHMHDILKSNIN